MRHFSEIKGYNILLAFIIPHSPGDLDGRDHRPHRPAVARPIGRGGDQEDESPVSVFACLSYEEVVLRYIFFIISRTLVTRLRRDPLPLHCWMYRQVLQMLLLLLAAPTLRLTLASKEVH